MRDAVAALEVLHGVELSGQAKDDAALLAFLAGQDVEEGSDERFRIARKVARDRIISTVDTQARHGHKSQARHFDGYKTHIAADPNSEIITQLAVTPANTPDRDVIDELIADVDEHDVDQDGSAEPSQPPVVVGDLANADAATRSRLEARGVDMAKVPAVRNSHGGFSKDRFTIDLDEGLVPAPPQTPSPSPRAVTVLGWRDLARCVHRVLCARPARRLAPVEAFPSIALSHYFSGLEAISAPMTGSGAIARTAPSPSEPWLASRCDGGEFGMHVAAAWRGSSPTCWPGRRAEPSEDGTA